MSTPPSPPSPSPPPPPPPPPSPSPSRPRSPFASESWEPRFVVEHHDERALRAAIDLWMFSSCGRRRAPGLFAHVARHGDCLLIAHPDLGLDSQDPWEVMTPPIEINALAAWIGMWLTTATYPKRPRFDGDEIQGFCVFWCHYQCVELVRRSMGPLVVMPKWFEIHQ
jgi:hypothetical protein